MAKAFLFHHSKWWFMYPEGYKQRGVNSVLFTPLYIYEFFVKFY